MAQNDNFMKKPPTFREGCCYSTFVTKTKYWCNATSIPKEKQAIVIALNLPSDGSCNNLSERLFSQLGDEGLVGEDGLVSFWQFMDKEYKKDPMGEMCEAIRKFTNFKRRADQSIKDYANEFETLYNKANLKGMGVLPQPYLMFLMFENSGMDEKDQRLIMVEVDFNKKDTLLQQTKDGMIKLFGGIKPIKERSNELKLMEDSATFYQNYQIRNPRPQANQFRGYGRPMGAPKQFGFNSRSRFLPPQHRLSGTPSGGGSKPKITASKLNPLQFGQVMQCHHCGAQTHLVKACPELNGWTFLNYQYENQEGHFDELDPSHSTFYSQEHEGNINPGFQGHSANQGNIDQHYNEQQYQEINTNDQSSKAYITDQISQAADIMNKTKLSSETDNYFNTFDILMAYEQKEYNLAMDQAWRKIIVDTGCVETVCGKDWIKDILDFMEDKTRKLVRVSPSSKVFRFGGGERKPSLGEYIIPINIGGKNIMLKTNVVDCQIPCLLSKKSMVAADMKLILRENSVKMFRDTTVQMDTIPTGHSVLTIEPFKHNVDNEFYALITLPDESQKEGMDYKRLVHIHEQLGHPGQHKMEIMLKEADLLDTNVKNSLNKLYQLCATCFIHCKSKPRPKVAPPIAHDLNETVCMDLKIWPKYGVIILYIIDVFTRFTQAFIIPDKTADSVIKPFLESWILNSFGAPKNVLFDNGLEFVNSKMRDLCKNFNIRMFTTAAFSPHQNGLCERNHQVVDEIIEKMITGGSYAKVKDALQPAIFAKNIMTNSTGYSPYQLVYGKNPRIPGAIDNSPPAQDGMTSSALIQKRLTGIFEARKALAKADNKARLKLAERSSRAPKLEKYEMGDQVYYKFGREPGWQGPGRIVAQDNKLVFIRHGRNIIVSSLARVSKVFPNHSIPPAQEFTSPDTSIQQAPRISSISETVKHENVEKPSGKQTVTVDSEDSDDEELIIQSNREQPTMIQNDSTVQELNADNLISPTPVNDQNLEENGSSLSLENNTPLKDNILDRKRLRSTPTPPKTNSYGNLQKKPRQHPKKSSPASYKMKQARIYPKSGDMIFIRIKGDESENNWEKITITKRVTKGDQSPHGPYFNFKRENGSLDGNYLDYYDWHFNINHQVQSTPIRTDINAFLTDSIDSNLSDLSNIDFEVPQHNLQEIQSYVVFVPRKDHHLPEVIAAKQKELQHFKDYKVYRSIPDSGQPRISSGWVITRKEIDGKPGIKARLVCHGNQASLLQQSIDERSDSPTVKKSSVRLLLFLAAQYGWRIETRDVTAAFLQADDLEREIFVQPPQESEDRNNLWCLIKPMYGLDEASHRWFITISTFLVDELKCDQTLDDPCMFTYKVDKKLRGAIVIHVDDLAEGGYTDFKLNVIKPLIDRFKFGAHKQEDFKLLGLDIQQKGGEIFMSQNDYIDAKIDYLPIQVPKANLDQELNQEQKKILWGMIGKCRWVCDQTRPDIAYKELELSIRQRRATFRDVKTANQIITQLKINPYWIKYTKIPGSRWFISVFVDASLKGLPDSIESAFGFIIMISAGYIPGERRKACVVTWKSGKVNRVVTSTYEAEAIALTQASEEAIAIKRQVIALTDIPSDLILIEVFCDNHDVVSSVHSTKDACKSTRVRADVGRMKQIVDRKEIEVLHWIPTEKQLADVFTKGTVSKVAICSTLENGTFEE